MQVLHKSPSNESMVEPRSERGPMTHCPPLNMKDHFVNILIFLKKIIDLKN